VNKEELRQDWLWQAEACHKGHAEFQRRWYGISMTSAISALVFATIGTVSAILGFYPLFFTQIPVVAWFIWETRDCEMKRRKSGKEWLEMRQFRLEMADQYR
jgi:hypothetical protein